jgi:acyl carrier protein
VATIDTVKSLLGDVLNIDSRAQSLTRESALLGSIPELDSMAVVGLISALEDQFGIMIEDDEMDASIFASVGSLVDFVDGKLAS